MALVTSGTLSIGGTATNRSINLELGLSQNANSSLNQSTSMVKVQAYVKHKHFTLIHKMTLMNIVKQQQLM